MITHEEALSELEAFQKMIGLRLDKVEKYITQQEQFAKDVARLIELRNKPPKSLDELREYWALEEKLSKVGKEL
jgi:hypothetical protein